MRDRNADFLTPGDAAFACVTGAAQPCTASPAGAQTHLAQARIPFVHDTSPERGWQTAGESVICLLLELRIRVGQRLSKGDVAGSTCRMFSSRYMLKVSIYRLEGEPMPILQAFGPSAGHPRLPPAGVGPSVAARKYGVLPMPAGDRKSVV